jgi:hypothetical protein
VVSGNLGAAGQPHLAPKDRHSLVPALDRMRYTLHANTASNAKRKRLSDNSDKNFFISRDRGGSWASLFSNKSGYRKAFVLPFGIVADEVLKVETGYKVMTFRRHCQPIKL